MLVGFMERSCAERLGRWCRSLDPATGRTGRGVARRGGWRLAAVTRILRQVRLGLSGLRNNQMKIPWAGGFWLYNR